MMAALYYYGFGGSDMCGPLIDWNGNGQIDPSDIAITLAAAEEEEMGDEDE